MVKRVGASALVLICLISLAAASSVSVKPVLKPTAHKPTAITYSPDPITAQYYNPTTTTATTTTVRGAGVSSTIPAVELPASICLDQIQIKRIENLKPKDGTWIYQRAYADALRDVRAIMNLPGGGYYKGPGYYEYYEWSKEN